MKVNYLEFLVVDFSFNWHYSFEFGQNVPPPPLQLQQDPLPPCYVSMLSYKQ